MIIGTYCKSFTFFQKLFPKNPLFRGGFKLQMARVRCISLFNAFNGEI